MIQLCECLVVHPSALLSSSLVQSYQIQGAFIASQAPLENTTEDYWRMIWQYKCPIIVMLTQLTEQGVVSLPHSSVCPTHPLTPPLAHHIGAVCPLLASGPASAVW